MIDNRIFGGGKGSDALGMASPKSVTGTLSSDGKTLTFAWPDDVDPHKICALYLSSSRTTGVGTGYHIAGIDHYFLTRLARGCIENNGIAPTGEIAGSLSSGVSVCYEIGTTSYTGYYNILAMYAYKGTLVNGNQPSFWVHADDSGLTVQTNGTIANLDTYADMTGFTFRNTMSLGVWYYV